MSQADEIKKKPEKASKMTTEQKHLLDNI